MQSYIIIMLDVRAQPPLLAWNYVSPDEGIGLHSLSDPIILAVTASKRCGCLASSTNTHSLRIKFPCCWFRFILQT
jgi:hypothetical protein